MVELADIIVFREEVFERAHQLSTFDRVLAFGGFLFDRIFSFQNSKLAQFSEDLML